MVCGCEKGLGAGGVGGGLSKEIVRVGIDHKGPGEPQA